MEPSTGFKARGSFGMPPEMQHQLEESRRKTLAHAKQDAPPIPGIPGPAQAAETTPELPVAKPAEDTDREKKFHDLKKGVEERLEATLTGDDIKDYIFKGSLTKEVTISPGFLKGCFRTLTPTEYFEIDKREAEYRDQGVFTTEGLANQRAIVTLSYAWISIGEPGQEMRPLAPTNDASIREKHIRKLGAHIVEFAVAANTDLNTLLKLTLQEKAFIKKS